MQIKMDRSTLSKKQLELLNSKEDRVLFGGARGGGKTWVIRFAILEDALMFPGRKILFWRPTIKSAKAQLSPAHISMFLPRSIEDPATGKDIPVWSFNSNEGYYKFANGPDKRFPFDGGSRIILGGIQTKADAYEYQGLEYVSMYADELNKTDWEATEYILGSLRDDKYPVKFRAAANPGERAHKEVKKAFVTPHTMVKKHRNLDKNYSEKLSWTTTKIDEEDGEKAITSWAYIPATLKDNPSEKIKKEYLKILLNYPKHLRDMYRYGSWDTYEGKYWDDVDFSDVIMPKRKLVDYGIDLEWELKHSRTFLSMDWGYKDNTDITWFVETSKGPIIAYKNLYITGNLMEDIAKKSEELSRSMGVYPKQIYAPWDIFSKKGIKAYTDGGELMGEDLVSVWRHYSKVPVIKAYSDRIAGWQTVTEHFKQKIVIKKPVLGENGVVRQIIEKLPKLIILKYECESLVDQINAAQLDPAKPNDILKGKEDHSIDSLRMFCVAHTPSEDIKFDLSTPIPGTIEYIRHQHKLENKKKKKIITTQSRRRRYV